ARSAVDACNDAPVLGRKTPANRTTAARQPAALELVDGLFAAAVATAAITVSIAANSAQRRQYSEAYPHPIEWFHVLPLLANQLSSAQSLPISARSKAPRARELVACR